MVYTLCLLLFMIGLYGVLTQKNLIKIIIGLGIMEYAVNMLLIMVGYRHDGIVPILDRAMPLDEFLARAVDPLPQAMVLTAIVINVAVLALSIAIAMRLYQKYGTYDITEIRQLRG
ncbi:MAG: cation:proton antiporter [Actinobacteria bacterium]|nr:cation:proton antiporter [Actinomycetota bacterium]